MVERKPCWLRDLATACMFTVYTSVLCTVHNFIQTTTQGGVYCGSTRTIIMHQQRSCWKRHEPRDRPQSSPACSSTSPMRSKRPAIPAHRKQSYS